MSARGTSSAYDTLFSGCVRGPSERDGKICPRDFHYEPLLLGSHKVSVMHAIGEMARAIEYADLVSYKEAVKALVVASFKAEFELGKGVTIQILDPENDIGLTPGEVLELVQDCFYRPPANLEFQVNAVRFGHKVSISQSP